MNFNLEQAKNLLASFGGDDTLVTVEHHPDGLEMDDEVGAKENPGPGLYAYYTEYPEDGMMFLGND